MSGAEWIFIVVARLCSSVGSRSGRQWFWIVEYFFGLYCELVEYYEFVDLVDRRFGL